MSHIWRRLSLGARILLLSGLGAALTLVLGSVGWWGFSRASTQMATTMFYMQALRNQADADMMHDSIRADVLEILLLREAEDPAAALKSLGEHVGRMGRAMRENRTLSLSPQLNELIESAEAELESYAASARSVAHARTISREAAEAKRKDFELRFDVLEGKMEKLSDSLEQEAAVNKSAAEQFLVRCGWWIAILTALVVAITLLIGWWLSNLIGKLLSRMTGKLSSSLDNVRRVSHGLASSSESLAANQQEQATAITQTSAHSESISRGVAEAAEQFRMVGGQMEDLAAHMQDSQHVVAELEASMKQIANSNRNVAELMKLLDSIAFQTNLLALNASVEAARAGQAGAGFAVVADEVRALAVRASDASRQIGDHVRESIEKANHGVLNLDRVLEAFSRSKATTTSVAASTEAVLQDSNRQADNVKDISTTLRSMAALTTEAAQRASSGAEMADVLNTELLALDEVFREVVQLVGAEAEG